MWGGADGGWQARKELKLRWWVIWTLNFQSVLLPCHFYYPSALLVHPVDVSNSVNFNFIISLPSHMSCYRFPQSELSASSWAPARLLHGEWPHPGLPTSANCAVLPRGPSRLCCFMCFCLCWVVLPSCHPVEHILLQFLWNSPFLLSLWECLFFPHAVWHPAYTHLRESVHSRGQGPRLFSAGFVAVSRIVCAPQWVFSK